MGLMVQDDRLQCISLLKNSFYQENEQVFFAQVEQCHLTLHFYLLAFISPTQKNNFNANLFVKHLAMFSKKLDKNQFEISS